MRKSSLTRALFRPYVAEILAATTVRPEQEWFMADLAKQLRAPATSLQRPLANLVAAGVLLRRRDGNRVYYRADPECPILGELGGIVVKTVGVVQPIEDALRPLREKIIAAFVHGSVAEGRERSVSDVDLIIIGDVPGPAIAGALRPLRERLGREVNVTRYSPAEFIAKRSTDSFLSVVMAKPKLYAIGNDAVLERLGKTERPRAAGRHKGRAG